jgi:DNA-binding transcriptional ArsR family regulator
MAASVESELMPVATGEPTCRAVAPSAPSELAWILNLLVQTAAYAQPALAELDQSLLPGIHRMREPLRDQFRSLWDDDVAGCPELLLVAHHAGCLLEPDQKPLLDWLAIGTKRPAQDYELLSEPPAVRAAVVARLHRLLDQVAQRRRYGALVADVWKLARSAWEDEGRAVAGRACEAWLERLGRGTPLEDLVAPRHPLTRADQLGFEDPFAHRSSFAVSPLYFCMSGGHVVDVGEYVHVAVPASDLLPIRKLRDAAFVADRLRVLSESTRAHILIQLLSAPSSVMELSRALRISQPTVSGHIKVLREAGLIQKRRLGSRSVFVASMKRTDRLLEDARGTLARWD